ncbi:PHP domain-containing protein [Lacticaseibacillus mingshuiensis]|uniref:Histidinol-phosphatase n=1 Tax=Lacticaseibacillus mingshuiensis TaxID=2799574 RepID=A0ABW4CGU9_9LACO
MYYDQHVHTYFSFDSQAPFEGYLHQSQAPLVTTDHLEMANPDDAGHNDLPDQLAYQQKRAELRGAFPNRILTGVECGYYAPCLKETYDYLRRADYDLVLLSFHHDGHHDFQDDYFKSVPKRAHVENYYQLMAAGVAEFEGADVLAHFDYGLRVLDVTPAELTAWVKPQLMAIFRMAVAKHLAFEVNTKSMFLWGNEALYETALPWYQEAGGTLFTLGSDAHSNDKYEMDFDRAKAFLHRHGVTQLATYQQHTPHLVDF